MDKESKLLSLACENGNLDKVKEMLDKGADVEFTNDKDQTPLYIACFYGHIDIARLLIKNNARIYPDNQSETPLVISCRNNHPRIVKLLLNSNSNITPEYLLKQNPSLIYHASRYGSLATVKLLIDNGADVNYKNVYNWTPLHTACMFNYPDIVKILLEAGANVEDESEEGHTPLYLACKYDHLSTVKLLLEFGANPNFINKNGKSAIEEYNNMNETVKYLMIEHLVRYDKITYEISNDILEMIYIRQNARSRKRTQKSLMV